MARRPGFYQEKRETNLKLTREFWNGSSLLIFQELFISKNSVKIEYMDIAKIIDQTNIKRDTTAEDIKKTCQEAREFGFRGVCINPEWVKLVKENLKGTGIKVIVLIDPPIGDSPHQERIRICQKAKEDGADELDVVINISAIKHERYGEVLEDLKKISKTLPTKVIIGSGYLTDEEIERASEVVKESGAVCVKTSTEKDPLDHFELKEKARHLKIMKVAAPGLLIKAAGNIKTLDDLKMMVDSGADLIGTSNGVQIMKEAEKSRN
jgi:deoxyribose-phosphate aldolase